MKKVIHVSLMKILFIVSFVLLIPIFSFSSEKFKEGFKETEQRIQKEKRAGLLAFDYRQADYFITNISYNRNIADEMLLVFPNVKVLERNVEKIKKLSNDIYVFVLEDKSDNVKLKNRSFEEMDINRLDGINLIKLSIDKSYEPVLLTFLDNDIIFSSSFFKDVIFPKYAQYTKYGYIRGVK